MDTDQPLTVAALRALIADLPDETPVRAAPECENDCVVDLHVLTHATVDRRTIDWNGLEYEGRPYLLLDTRSESIAEHRTLTTPATTEDA